MGIQEVILECDSQIVADALKGVSEPLTMISTTIEGICHKLQDLDKYNFPILEGKTTVQHTSWLNMSIILLVV